MPTYTYQCPDCGWSGDRVASIANRNKQYCHELLTQPDPKGDPEQVQDTRKPCGAKLTRDEIPESQARCSHNWSEWQR